MAQRHLDRTLARHVRELIAGGHATTSELAEDIGCSVKTIQYAVKGHTWRDAGGPIRRRRPPNTWLWGERSPHARLTSAEVHRIRENLEGLSDGEWSEKLGVSRTAIRFARTRRTWKHLA